MLNISVVIVTFHEDEHILRACFERLFTTVGVNLEIWIVDNAHRALTKKLVDELLPQARYIAHDKNMGFAYAVNRAMSQSTGDYVLLLNPDTEIQDTSIYALSARMEENPDVGIGSCLITYPDGTIQESIRRFPRLTDQIMTLLKLPKMFSHLQAIDRYMMRDVDIMCTQNVDSIMGACMMIRRKLLETIGLFDERYFIWFEEVDYCAMAVAAGWKVRHFADVRITHHKGHMFKKLETLQKQYWIRTSMRKYFLKHYGFGHWLVLWLLAPIFILCAYVAHIVGRIAKAYV